MLLPCLCQEPCGHPDMEFHLESLKSIPVAELGTLDRLGGQPPPPAEKKGGRSPREKEAAAPSWGHVPGRRWGEAGGLAAELNDLARDLEDPGQGRREKRKGRRGKSPERCARNPVRGRKQQGQQLRPNPDGHCSVSSGIARRRRKRKKKKKRGEADPERQVGRLIGAPLARGSR